MVSLPMRPSAESDPTTAWVARETGSPRLDRRARRPAPAVGPMVRGRSPVPARIARLVVVCAVVLHGCAADDPATEGPAIDTLANGAVRVRNRVADGWAAGEAWRLVEDLRVGLVEGDPAYLFGSIAAVEVDGDGNLYVLDSQSADVRVFDPKGAHLRTLGRSGDGPGELRRPQALFWGPDSLLWVYDPMAQRFTAFRRDGEFAEAVPRRAIGWSLPWPGGFLPSGRLADMVDFQEGPDAPRRQMFAIISPGDEGADADTVALPPWEERVLASSGGRFTINVPFAPRRHIAFDPSGGAWIATGEAYRLVRIALPSADTTRIVEIDIGPRPLEDEHAEAAMEQLRDRGVEVTRADLPSHRPAMGAIWRADNGDLWVRRGMTVPDTVDVFDAAGVYLGTLAVDVSTWPLPVVRYDHLYSVERGEFDVPQVVRWRIVREPEPDP